ncbi:MAG: 50S ribosomal protein L19 [Lentisphaeria bacterium]
MMNTLQKLHKANLKTDVPTFSVGDTVRADIKVVEGGKERIQSFTGTVLGTNGQGISETVTLRRVAYGQGIERVLPIHSPRLANLTVVRRGKTKRGKLYNLREQKGKVARVKELI